MTVVRNEAKNERHAGDFVFLPVVGPGETLRITEVI